MNPKRIASAAACLIAALASSSVAADVPPVCNRHLSVEITPGVPNPRDLAFLSSLLTQPGFQLAWRGQNDDGSVIELDLTGPGPDDQCRAVIAAMRKDSRVQSITVRK